MALNVTTKALAITLIAVAITRSLISVESLFHVLWQVHAINKKQVTHMIFLTKKLILIPAALMLVMAIAIPAFALNGMAATSAPYEQQVLQARYDMTSANVGFITGVMADAVSLIPQASNLQAPADKLNSDLATLQGYVSSVDNAGFNSYIQNTIIPIRTPPSPPSRTTGSSGNHGTLPLRKRLRWLRITRPGRRPTTPRSTMPGSS